MSVVRHVLVVDDDDLLAEVARAALELVAGWQVTTAGSGAQAQLLAVSARPDVVLLDVMMPGQDGPATALAIRSNPDSAEVPIIFLTAKSHPEEENHRWRHLALAGVIPKPFDPMTLSAHMARILGWSG
ncbi:MAG: response regulator receiver protein [Friedmanniella sp.]|nr:response regulator receiver protein [Friedmanniella sp.]